MFECTKSPKLNLYRLPCKNPTSIYRAALFFFLTLDFDIALPRIKSMRSLREVYLWRLLRALNSLEINSLRVTRDIRLAADVSLALTAPKGSIWSHALLANISKHEKNRDILQKIAGKSKYMIITRALQRNDLQYMCLGSVFPKSRESILQRSRLVRRSIPHRKNASHISPSMVARKIVQKRTRILQSLVPGGSSMDISCLLKETADYIISLKAQVQVMQFLADAAH